MPSVHVTGFFVPLHLRPHRQTEAGKAGTTLEVSQSTVQQWENGKNVSSLENLEKIARIRGWWWRILLLTCMGAQVG
ncbi:helix-turn-helix transcriptional regulator (plasmid) [Phormidium sp. CLA17]|uniref:helix-turn-helix transcriptional regulator n=1 Tax=Leptolyngbya sp. Cla-17 TaxID=2803751 RepID=UPI0014926694|nr:helix-turn-helix transcriptional regulator [Leptolyngbya sp. Cla-17]MBM0745767.1 helix-turn-helix transcriptional regulator [Leptolyngbya sp. Cla-17]